MSDRIDEPAALELRLLLLITGRLSNRSLEQRLRAQGIPISGLQLGALNILRSQPHTLSELSRRLLLDPATLVPVVDALERHGFARRERDPTDRRRVPVSLTEKGRALLGRLSAEAMHDALPEAFAQLGVERCRQLRELLAELLVHMPEGEAMLSEIAAAVEAARNS